MGDSNNPSQDQQQQTSWIAQIQRDIHDGRNTNAQRTTQTTGFRPEFYRVPAHFRELRDQSIDLPRKISIGPYHHGTPSFQQREGDKKKALINFLSRSPNVLLKNYTDSVAEMVNEMRCMYDGLDDRWLGEDNNEAFVKMMVLDGCYLLEIMLEAMEARGFFGDTRPDPVFNHREMEDYKHDMLLFDNQMPLKVLVRICEISFRNSQILGKFKDISSFTVEKAIFQQLLETQPNPNDGTQVENDQPKPNDGTQEENADTRTKSFPFLKYLIHCFFFSLVAPDVEKVTESSCHHLLAIYRLGILCGQEFNSSTVGEDFFVSAWHDFVPSATQLESARIGITSALPFVSQIYISLDRRTGLTLQKIYVDGPTISNFQNVILYERLNPTQNNHFSSYIYFLHSLLKDAADSAVLRAHGILSTTLPDEEVIKLFNKLCENISFHRGKAMDGWICKVGNQLTSLYERKMRWWRKHLVLKYFDTYWTLIPISAAVIIFICTIFQTFYTIQGYYKGNN